MACTDIGAVDCFSNYDCADVATRCENVGTPNLPVACCVSGARGTGALGDVCVSENDCKSSLCIDTGQSMLCSDICSGTAACIPALAKCTTIAFSGTTDKFCIP